MSPRVYTYTPEALSDSNFPPAKSARSVRQDAPLSGRRSVESRLWDGESEGDAEDLDDIRALTAQEAAALRERHPPLSPWRVVAFQVVVGGLAAATGGWVFSDWAVFWSALYGAGVVVVPAALMAWGLRRGASEMTAGHGAVRFMSWEFVKIAGSVVLMLLAPGVLVHVNWLALIVGLVVCTKVYWWALLGRRHRT